MEKESFVRRKAREIERVINSFDINLKILSLSTAAARVFEIRKVNLFLFYSIFNAAA